MNTAMSVMMPIIRRVMPTIIANDIIGVSGPGFSMLSKLRVTGWSGRLRMNKTHYGHFLRVYNRRKFHHPEYITSLGYQHVRISRRDYFYVDAEQWCLDNLRYGSYVCSFADFWFAYDADAVLFKMSWL